MPTLDPAFLLTPPWLKLTPAAQAALRGMLEFAIHKHGEWSVEATAPQISAWVGSESGLGAKSIAAGITELEACTLLKRVRVASRSTAFVITAPLQR
ncbi:MAG TPA: hypothetical protein VHN77_06070 [Phycisphaerales bacterium]|nr:hypothetical protein [Phycisphaerales bacterium]